MNKIKIAIVVKILILILLILIGYFIWIFFPEPTRPKSERAFIPPANYNIKTPVSNSAKTIEIPPFSQERRIYMPSNEITSLFFEKIYETIKTTEIKVENKIGTVAQDTLITSSNSKIATSTPNEIILSLTIEEFHRLYPDIFIKSLVDAQYLFVKNTDPSYEPLLKIETDAQIRLVEEKIVATLVSLNMLTEKEGHRAIITIRYTLPRLQLVELKARKSLFLNQYFNFPLPAKSPSKKLFLAGLMEMLQSALISKAQAGECGECHNFPECYQPGLPSPTPGINVFKAFCSCSGCYYGQGCLDFCSGGSAIFDPMEFICGCGY